MASPAAILRAAKAAQGQQFRPGAAAPTPPPQGQWYGAYSPAALNADPGLAGYNPGYGPFLPRPPQTFTEAAFSPFSPILPVPINQPEPGERLPYPRRESYPVGWNLPQTPPGTEGLKLASFQTLQTLADLYSVARACIQVRKAEIRGLEWEIVLTKDAEKAYKGDRAAMRDFGERRDEARKFFSRPDPDYWNFESWLDDLLEQVFVFDALSIFLQPVRGRGLGKGLLGSDLDCLQLVDGQTMRPLYDVYGGSPKPPAPALQQFLWGVPRADFTSVLTGEDLREAGMTDAQWLPFARDQMLYLPMTRRRWTPYGFPPVERALIPIMSGLQKQGFQLDFYREGTVPAVFIAPGDAAMTPNQIRELQDALNAVAGDPAWHHKIIVLPPGSKTMPQKDASLADDFDSIVMTQVCMAFDVKPMELGILPQVSTVASPFAAREAAQASRSMHQRVSTKPLMKFLSGIFDGILQNVCGQRDLRFLFTGQEEVQDQAAMTDLLVKQVQSGLRSIDEARDELGLTPWGYEETSEPDVFTPSGPIPLTDATHLAVAQAQQAIEGPKPSGGAKPSGKPPKPSSGAHAAASGGMNRSGRPGSVTERQRSRGGRLAPTHAQGTGAPGRATGKPAPKAALAELEALGRHLRKGRAISTWEPVHLDARTLAVVSEDIAKGLTPEQAVTVAAEIFKATGGGAAGPKGQQPPPKPLTPAQIAAAYGPQVAAAFAAAIAAAAALIAAWIAGTLAVTAGVLAGMILAELRKHLGAALDALWRQAWDAAVAHAQEHAGSAADADAVRHDLEAFLATHGANWVSMISGTGEHRLSQAIKDAVRSGDPQTLAGRLADILKVALRVPMIAVTETTRAWNAAMEKVARHLGLMVAWTVHSANPCPKCLEAQAAGPLPAGSIFPGTELAAPPSHTRCECELILVVHRAAKALTRHVMDNGQQYWADDGDFAAGGGAMPPSAHNGDGLGTPVTYPALWPFPHRAAPQEPVQGGVVGSTAGGEPPHWDGSEPFPADRSQPAGDDGAWGLAAGTGSPPQVMWPGNYLDGYWPEGGHGDQQPPASTIPGGPGRGRAPNAVGKAADGAEAVATWLEKAPKAKAATVRQQLLANYPPESVAWVREAEWWRGPVEVPLDAIDWDDESGWAAHHQKAKVKEFMRQLRVREHVNPAVGILRPGSDRVVIIDGHHRSLACKRLGWPSRMYVGLICDEGAEKDALESHLYQEHQGASPAND